MEINEYSEVKHDQEYNLPVRNKATRIDCRADARAIVVSFKKQLLNNERDKVVNKGGEDNHYTLSGIEFEAWYNLEIKIQVEGEWVTVKLGDFLLDSVHPRSLREIGIED